MLKRKIMKELYDWKKESHKKALCIAGPRQIGKTTIVREFARREYENFIELNFLTNEKASLLFAESLEPDILIRNISAYAGKRLVPGKTLILFDEVQACPAARRAVKFLCDKTPFAYIETGSMLGLTLEQVRSLPVGFEKIIYMFPLDLEEYCWARGISETVLKDVKHCYENKIPTDPAIHEILLRIVREYLAIGGMPEVVVNFLETHDMKDVHSQQKSLIQLFQSDIQIYAMPSEKIKILEIFKGIPAQLSAKNKRFMLSQVIPKAKLSRNENCFIWLLEAGIALPCYNVALPQAPLILNIKRSLFKLFLFDTGLLTAFLGSEAQVELLTGNNDFNFGAVLENFFAQQLRANGFDLYYYNSKSLGEVDFVLQDGSKTDLVEIKSGNSWQNHPAIDKVSNQPDWKFRKKIVFCEGNVMEKDGILYLPWYMVQFYHPFRFEEPFIIPDIDLSVLEKKK